MSRALLIIDIQRDYFPGGAFPLVEPEAAARVAGDLLTHFRDGGEHVLHLRHVWDAPDAAFMRPGTDGIEIHDLVAPQAGELDLDKTQPNGFLDTDLEGELRAAGIEDLVVVGMMSSMCVDATVRAASDLGFGVTLVHDGCAAPDLEFSGSPIPGAMVHGAFMAALGDGYATVVAGSDVS
jgi:nicotinamidase-related amidase